MKNAEDWFYTGNLIDLEYPKEVCQWCGKTGLRYQFEVMNKEDYELLLVGSECIKKFGIEVLSEDGSPLDIKYASKKLNKDKNELIRENRKARVISTLMELSEIDSGKEYHNMIDYYNEREAFTPKQLSFLFWRLDENKVSYNKNDFKMILMRNREKMQLLKMPEWKVNKLWKSMSKNQRQWYKNNKSEE